MKNFLIGAATLLLCSSAWPITRVGTSNVIEDKALGFRLAVPNGVDFDVGHQEQDKVLLRISRYLSPGMVQPQLIWIRTLASALPSWTNKDRSDLRSSLSQAQQTQWFEMPDDDDCIESYFGYSDSSESVLLSWGPGRGLVFQSSGGDHMTQIILRGMPQTIDLMQGACTWTP